MIEYLHEHPVQTIPVVLKTVEDYQKNFLKKKEDMQHTWRQDCNKNWSKSLDHKSFNFRTNEKKTQVAREFQSKMKQLMEQSKKLKDPVLQKAALEFYTGLEGQEAKALDLNV